MSGSETLAFLFQKQTLDRCRISPKNKNTLKNISGRSKVSVAPNISKNSAPYRLSLGMSDPQTVLQSLKWNNYFCQKQTLTSRAISLSPEHIWILKLFWPINIECLPNITKIHSPTPFRLGNECPSNFHTKFEIWLKKEQKWSSILGPY